MEKRYFEGVQDCKEFKGELFGICNLFRDLSDKLLTSEIVELHETSKKDGLKTEQQKKINLSEETDLLASESETRLCAESERAEPSKPDIEFEDLDCAPKKSKVRLIDEGKRVQFSLIAESMGMGELAFSKWLLSATPVEREKVLIDYKKKKKMLKG